MHTPVSIAAQGAYIVAACVTGLIAGGASLLFKDVTEGISCFLGGFCFSMWILVLRSGGTIPNTTGKIIFISCFTVGTPALYISHRTRPYGLIGSTSFAGATAIVLGIDCFSRAGLKEFWLYIWSMPPAFPSTPKIILTPRLITDINSEIFPLHYNGPYPITRGIQVETGAIIIVCAIGITSQMKVWKIIRRRKEEMAREQSRRDDEGNMVDEEHGRRVENGIKQERGSWEAAYGSGERGKIQHLDSGIGTDEPSTRKASLNIVGSSDARGSNPEGIELQEMNAFPNGVHKDGRLVVHVIQDDEIFPATSTVGQHWARSTRGSREPSIHESQTGASNNCCSEASQKEASAHRSVDKCLTLKPKITHLPFKVPNSTSGSEDGHSSVVASAASGNMADRLSKRLSGSSIVRKLSQKSQRSFIAASTSEEALMLPDTDDDRASSAAATFDGVSEKDDLEEGTLSVRDQRPSFEILRKQESMQALIWGTGPVADIGEDAEQPPKQSAAQTTLGDSQAEEAQPVNGSIDPRPESVALPDSEIASIMDAPSTVEESNIDSRTSPAAKSEASERQLRVTSFSTNLPGGASRVVTAYRTNEWAKHLDGADLPEIEELKIQKTRAPYSSPPIDRVAPVDVRALQQTPLSAEPAPILTVQTHSLGERPASYFKSKNPFNKQQDTQPLKPMGRRVTREKAIERTPSQTSLSNSMERSPSQTSLSSTQSYKEQYRPPLPKFRSSQSSIPSARVFRRSSTPMISSPLVESPIEEGVEASFPTRFSPSSTHLMSKRDSIIRNKPSSTSLFRTSWSNVALDQHPALRAVNEDENISLSQRKSLLQQNPHSIPQLHHSSSSGPSSGATTPLHRPSRLSPQPPSGRPPAPAPTPTPHNSTTISAWRASLQASTTADHHDQEIEARRVSLLAEKRHESESRLEQRTSKTISQGLKDRGMRHSGMIELHQQQMRKMQAQANKSLI